jgi:hypothetical protein
MVAQDLGPARDTANVDVAARELEAALAGRMWHRKEIDALLPEKSSTAWSGTGVPLVRVPPSPGRVAKTEFQP